MIEQEPIAEMVRGQAYPFSNDGKFRNLPDGTLLYTSPQPCSRCEELKAENRDACVGLNDYYGAKLAAAEAVIKQVWDCRSNPEAVYKAITAYREGKK